MKKLFTLTVLAILAGLHVFSTPDNPPVHLMRSNLYVMGSGGDTTLLDGDLTQYDTSFTNAVDGMDARKMSNFSENIGMIRQATTLVVERRHTIEANDTTFYRVWNLTTSRNYQLQFAMTDMEQPGIAAYLEDLYLNTKTPVSLTGITYANFGINFDPASSNAYRFRLVFTTAASGTLPLTFTSQDAYLQGNAVAINWKTAAENNMKDYNIESSTDGKTFTVLGTRKAGNLSANNYSYTDAYPTEGDNYYRINGTTIDGNSKFSSVMKVHVEGGFALLKVFPNPVTSNTVNVSFINQPAGLYKIRLVSTFGQCLYTKDINHAGGNLAQSFNLPAGTPHGIYQLEIIKPSGPKTNISLVY